MSAHTQGRLELCDRVGDVIGLKHSHGHVPGAISLVVAQVASRQTWRAEGEANARRLAACWNACEGSETEILEQLGADFIRPLIDLINERDQLLAGRVASQTNFNLVSAGFAEMQAERDQLRAEIEAAHTERKRLAHELATALAAVPPCEPGTGDYAEIVRGMAEDIVHAACIMGVVLTISQVPRLPLAMGNYKTVVQVRAARERAL